MKFFLYSIILLLAGVSSSCQGVRTYSTQSKDVDLKNYKTYAWIKPSDPDGDFRRDDKIYSKLILELANNELLKKGFVLDTLQPQAVFTFDTRVHEQSSYSQGALPNAGLGYAYGGYGYYGGFYAPIPVSSGASRHEYEEGLLYIDMFDAKTRVPVWGGWAKAKLTAKSDVEADVRKAVKDIFVRLHVRHK